MTTQELIAKIIPRTIDSGYKDLRFALGLNYGRVMRGYADWRVGAHKDEMSSGSEKVLLTFDDYGSDEQVTRILDILSAQNARAVFFLQGNWAEKNPAIVAKIQVRGQLVGNHTYSHPDLLSLTNDAVRFELKNGPESRWLRPPRGRFNNRIRVIAAELGMTIKYWSIDSDDWQGVSKDLMLRKVVPQLQQGAVILFHIHADETALALPELIHQIRARGLELPSIDEPVWGAK
jgi:peptidoglycan/xylan/chitin deacetylase (PgdA/CDA1 family)